ncbi:autotransporter domain-containing protein [Solilutibacter silvestris]|uniref:GDSL-like Lipase/Acylhydrolase n=1 Tax=Solilutibacter silvestris TaxID=1645665 RepID=A0A2K1PX76_9GAMM|nr:autotransporter domain-containing protein [Lysobacter silvestris]PNS07384.1 GDSL-like Lipase/Acylhydrolase [Lysobacter silvestris]
MRTKLLCTALASALSMVALPAAAQYVDTHAQTFSQTIFFGDSLTDAGFFRPLLPANAQPVIGQFTTNPGTTWAQNLARYYGQNGNAAWLASPTGPAASTGDDYAVGGARVVAPVSGALGPIPSVDQQVNFYLASTGGRADPRALYTVWGGANDLFAVVAGAPAQATIGAAVGGEVGIVGKLQAAGARYVLVPNIPDLGQTPSFRAQGAAAQAQGTQLAMAYNSALYQGLAGQGLRFIPLNTFGMIQEIVANPAPYGFTNVTGTACQPQITANSLTCNPTSYVTPDAPYTYAFADGVHPSLAAHKILGDYAVATLEGPRQIAILPLSAMSVGRARADLLSSQLASMRGNDGMRWWFNGNLDQQRYNRGPSGDGFNGVGPSLGGGLGWNSGAFRYGGAMNYGRQSIDYSARRGDFRQTDISIAGFAGWHNENAWVNAQLGYSRLQYNVHRDVPLGQVIRTHTGKANGSDIYGGIDAGWMFHGTKFDHGPVGEVLIQRISVDGFTESDANLSTALAYPKQTFNSRLASLGYEGRYHIAEGWTPFARLSVDREFGKMPTEARASMPSVGSMEFAVPGPSFDRSYGSLAVGLRGQFDGLDVMAGGTTTVARKGGNYRSLSLTVGKTF